MQAVQDQDKPKENAPAMTLRRLRPWQRLLLRGESIIASIGIALAAILLAVMAASGWWTMHIEQTAAASARVEQVKAVGQLLSASAEPLLATDDLSAVRRIISEAGIGHSLTKCRIILPDKRVIASMEPEDSRRALQNLPKSWGVAPDRHGHVGATEIEKSHDPIIDNAGQLAIDLPLRVLGRGPALLQIEAPVTKPLLNYWPAQTGVATIGAGAMIALLLVYRRTRSKLRGLTAVREALLAVRAAGGLGSAAPGSALWVNPTLGVEAEAWNDLMAEADRNRMQSVAERARQSLGRRHQSKGDLESACDAMSQGLLVIDERNGVKYTNGAAATFLQADRAQMIGADVAKFLHAPSVLEAIREISTGSVRRRSVIDVERKADAGGDGVLRFSIRPMRREDSAAVMVVIEDVTQQKAAEEARHSFVAQATHELRTPLTNIRLYVEMAIDEGERDAATRSKCLNVINGETRRLERIVGEMLSVAEIEAGSFKLRTDDVRLDALFDELSADFSEQADEKKIKLSFNLPPKLPVLRGDRDKVVLAMHNLVGNALKYTPGGGSVSVDVESNEKQLAVAVRDSGIGISSEDAEHIFDRFYRAKDTRVDKITGTGLGLTLAREVARLHGGDISVESQLNQGSTFTLTLPVNAMAA